MDRRTDGQKDGRTDGQTYIPPPLVGDNKGKQSCHSCMQLFAMNCAIILQSITKVFLMVPELRLKQK